MSIEDHPKFDETGFYKINKKHSIVFLHSDGFTKRLLNVKIFFTKLNKYEVYLQCFKKGNDYGNFRYEYESDEIPKTITRFIDRVNKTEELDFGYKNKDQSFMEDCHRQDVLFNHKGKTIGFHISGGMTISSDDFETEFGKSFYDFYSYLNNWKEELYNTFNNSCT